MFARTISFIVRNLKNPLYVLRYAYAFPQKGFCNNASFLSDDELVEELQKGKSLLRLGDGEIYMMNFGSIPQYEMYNAKLRDYYFKIVREYSPSSLYIIGIPTFVNDSNEELKKTGKFYVWLPLKVLYRFIFPHNVKYFDAHLFYKEGGFSRSLDKVLRDHKVIMVTRKYNIDLMEETKIHDRLSVSFIETPERDTFAQMDTLLEKIKTSVGNEKDKYRIVVACGPASKAIVYELSKCGIISYDIGRGIETAYRKNEIEYLI